MTAIFDVERAVILTFVYALIASGSAQKVARKPHLNNDDGKSCGEYQFTCRNGDCIASESLCDGRADCSDQSDETQAECSKPGLTCPDFAFRCDYGACVDGDAACNGVKDCIDNSDEALTRCPGISVADPQARCGLEDFRCTNGQCVNSTSLCDGTVDCADRSDETALACGSFPGAGDRTTTIKSGIRLKRGASSCLVPPQPSNGYWKLYRAQCDVDTDCNIPQGIRLDPGSQLVYSCNASYRMEGSPDVHCGFTGNWSAIPVCIEIKCSSLNSLSTVASCYDHSNELVSCDSTVSPGTRAEVSCRQGYMADTRYLSSRRNVVVCNSDGKWEPDPVRCIPVCGVANSHHTPLVHNGVKASIGDFPWHATLYKEIITEQGPQKEFQCGTTIIHIKLVMTAAHCIYDENAKITVNPAELFLVTGNTFLGYDSPLHDPKIVRKAEVKNIFMHCQYYGLEGNYGSDIALLELKQPFELSSILQPACLDLSGYSDQILEPGVFGKVAGFGRTELSANSAVLQTLTLPYILYSQCKSPTDNTDSEVLITNDKFCAGYTNGSAVCEGDSGGGMVFKKRGLWYVMGIVSVGLGVDISNGERTCDKYSYSLYTKVSNYISWIQDVIFDLERPESRPGCRSYTPPSPTRSNSPHLPMVMTSKTSELVSSRTKLNPLDSACLIPSHPAIGEWRLHPADCKENMNCIISEGVAMKHGSRLVYTCVSGFRIQGSPEIICGPQGRWSPIPTCIEITCSSLDDVSMISTCYRSNRPTPCNSAALPNTTALLSCRPAYEEDSRFLKAGSKTVTCKENGEWEPKPITCNPVCGTLTTRQSNHTMNNGTAADILQFPWHVTLYRQEKPPEDSKELKCGGTIIQNNLLLTAAHCVYDDNFKSVELAERFYVVTGNKVGDHESPFHDPQVVHRAAVKSIHIPCEYSSSEGNYNSDIALIELQEPFKLSGNLIPACMDVLGYNQELLKSGMVGRFVGFGETSSGLSSSALLTTNVPNNPNRNCGMTDSTEDKFCAEGQSGNTVCDEDSGSGLVIESNGRWHIMGVLSVTYGVKTVNGKRTCDGDAYSFFTKIPTHIPWIQNVMFNLERYGYYPSCEPDVYE